MKNLIRQLKDLIIVACHAVFLEGFTTPEKVGEDGSYVGGFPGEGRFYAEHMQRGVLLASQRKDSLLIISGQPTQERAGERSEARGYLDIARDHQWWGTPEVENRTILDEYARDSFENIVYPLALFKQETGAWPGSVTVVGWKFKMERCQAHAQAIGWPATRFFYEGVNNPEGRALKSAILNEAKLVDEVKADPFLIGTQFVAKRASRNPFGRRHPYRGIDTRLDQFFDFLDRNVYQQGFPWGKDS